MSTRTRGLLALAIAMLIEGILLLNVIWPFGAEVDEQPQWMWVIGLMSFPVAAALLLTYRPGNTVSWTLGIAAVSAGLIFLLSWYGEEFRGGPLSREIEALEKLPSVAQIVAVFALLHLFPTGRLVSRWHAWIFWGQIATFGVTTVLWILSPAPLIVTERPNPFGIAPEWLGAIGDNGPVLLAPFAMTGAISLVVRWRRADAAERAQFRWFTAAGVFCVAIFMPVFFLPGEEDAGGQWANTIVGLVVIGAFWSLPAAIVVAVLRYRLYDIDVLINRALVYASLTAATVGVYAALVVTFGWVAQAVSGQEGNEVVVAATTLIVAALFQPARRRIQGLVDRRFYRARYDAGRTIEAFQARLRDVTEIEVLRAELAATAHSALQPAGVGVWLRPDAGS